MEAKRIPRQNQERESRKVKLMKVRQERDFHIPLLFTDTRMKPTVVGKSQGCSPCFIGKQGERRGNKPA